MCYRGFVVAKAASLAKLGLNINNKHLAGYGIYIYIDMEMMADSVEISFSTREHKKSTNT